MPDETFASSELAVKATASLQKDIDNELKEKDPSPEKAKAVLEGKKNETT